MSLKVWKNQVPWKEKDENKMYFKTPQEFDEFVNNWDKQTLPDGFTFNEGESIDEPMVVIEASDVKGADLFLCNYLEIERMGRIWYYHINSMTISDQVVATEDVIGAYNVFLKLDKWLTYYKDIHFRATPSDIKILRSHADRYYKDAAQNLQPLYSLETGIFSSDNIDVVRQTTKVDMLRLEQVRNVNNTYNVPNTAFDDGGRGQGFIKVLPDDIQGTIIMDDGLPLTYKNQYGFTGNRVEMKFANRFKPFLHNIDEDIFGNKKSNSNGPDALPAQTGKLNNKYVYTFFYQIQEQEPIPIDPDVSIFVSDKPITGGVIDLGNNRRGTILSRIGNVINDELDSIDDLDTQKPETINGRWSIPSVPGEDLFKPIIDYDGTNLSKAIHSKATQISATEFYWDTIYMVQPKKYFSNVIYRPTGWDNPEPIATNYPIWQLNGFYSKRRYIRYNLNNEIIEDRIVQISHQENGQYLVDWDDIIGEITYTMEVVDSRGTADEFVAGVKKTLTIKNKVRPTQKNVWTLKEFNATPDMLIEAQDYTWSDQQIEEFLRFDNYNFSVANPEFDWRKEPKIKMSDIIIRDMYYMGQTNPLPYEIYGASTPIWLNQTITPNNMLDYVYVKPEENNNIRGKILSSQSGILTSYDPNLAITSDDYQQEIRMKKASTITGIETLRGNIAYDKERQKIEKISMGYGAVNSAFRNIIGMSFVANANAATPLLNIGATADAIVSTTLNIANMDRTHRKENFNNQQAIKAIQSTNIDLYNSTDQIRGLASSYFEILNTSDNYKSILGEREGVIRGLITYNTPSIKDLKEIAFQYHKYGYIQNAWRHATSFNELLNREDFNFLQLENASALNKHLNYDIASYMDEIYNKGVVLYNYQYVKDDIYKKFGNPSQTQNKELSLIN